MTEESGTVWVLVQFKPNSDAIAVRNLIRQGFSVFLPKTEQTQRQGGRFVKTVKPLFPGYLFAEVDLEFGGWRAINSTYGVSRIVTTAGKPTPVPRGLVDALKARCDETEIITTPPEFEAGETVKLNHGPFAEWVGKIVEMTADQRAWILIDLMGRETRVAVNVADLQSIS